MLFEGTKFVGTPWTSSPPPAWADWGTASPTEVSFTWWNKIQNLLLCCYSEILIGNCDFNRAYQLWTYKSYNIVFEKLIFPFSSILVEEKSSWLEFMETFYRLITRCTNCIYVFICIMPNDIPRICHMGTLCH